MGTLSNSRQRQSYSGFARLDAHFHDQIMEIAGNTLIRDTLAHLHTHFHIFRLMYHARITEEALSEHETLSGGALGRRRSWGGARHARAYRALAPASFAGVRMMYSAPRLELRCCSSGLGGCDAAG